MPKTKPAYVTVSKFVGQEFLVRLFMCQIDNVVKAHTPKEHRLALVDAHQRDAAWLNRLGHADDPRNQQRIGLVDGSAIDLNCQ